MLERTEWMRDERIDRMTERIGWQGEGGVINCRKDRMDGG